MDKIENAKNENKEYEIVVERLCQLNIKYSEIFKNIKILTKDCSKYNDCKYNYNDRMNDVFNYIQHLNDDKKRNLRINILCYKDFKNIFNKFAGHFIVIAAILFIFTVDLILKNLIGEYIIGNFINTLIGNIIKEEFVKKVIDSIFTGSILGSIFTLFVKFYNGAVKDDEFLIDKFIFYIEEYLDK